MVSQVLIQIVIFSKEYATFAQPVVMKLDPYHTALSAALFRESTRYIDGKIVKVGPLRLLTTGSFVSQP